MTNSQIAQNIPIEITSGNISDTTLLCRDNTVVFLPSDYKFRNNDRVVTYSNTNGSVTIADIPLTNYQPE